MKTLVLGSTGMLGYQVKIELEKLGISVIGTQRTDFSNQHDKTAFSAGNDSIESLLNQNPDITYVINAIGIIKPHINEKVPSSVLNAININSEFPYELAESAEKRGIKVIQIATDCVYSGLKGSYIETDIHDAVDVYGKTKSLGEVHSPAVMHLRSSIIGREFGRSTSLVEWVLGQPIGSTINGYTNHLWNGVTTSVFGKIAAGVILSGEFEKGVHHLIPQDVVTKFELVSAIASTCERSDIIVLESEASVLVDRTLTTNNNEVNQQLWLNAGYEKIPTILEIVSTLN